MSIVENADRGRWNGRPAQATGVKARPGWFWPLIVAGTYAVGVLAVAVAEYASELAKIGRGTFTDSFSPYLYGNLLTLPTSAAHPASVDYPTTFSATLFRHLVREAMLPTLANLAVQAVVIAVILRCISVWRRRATTP